MIAYRERSPRWRDTIARHARRVRYPELARIHRDEQTAQRAVPATERKSRHAFKALRLIASCCCLGTTAKGLSQREGGAAYNLTVDDDVHSVGADSQRASAQVVNILAAGDPEVRAGIGGAAVEGLVDGSNVPPAVRVTAMVAAGRPQVATPLRVRVNFTGTTPRLTRFMTAGPMPVGARRAPLQKSLRAFFECGGLTA